MPADNRAVKKHIYIYSPSGAVRDRAAFRRGVHRLEQLGHEVEIDPDALTTHQRFAGDDAVRLAALHRAAESGADITMISRGGYGLSRVLPEIRFKRLARAIERGTRFVGISDFTVVQLALLQQCGSVTWAGPALCEGFGPEAGPDDIMEDCFLDFVHGRGEGAGWRNPTPLADFHVKNAVLWGGNLSMLVSLLGTPYMPKVRNGVLFLEDVAEHPYRVERMLTQLLHAGVLASQKAIVLGQFTEYQLTSHDKGFSLKRVVEWLRGRLKTPVLTNLPFGHVPTKVLLPVGAKVDLISQGRDALLLWGHV